MPTFVPDQNPSFGVEETHEPDILRANFGDGYSQRFTNGINSDRVEVTLTWENATESERDTIFTFMAARGGYESFDYQPPGFSASKKWICSRWSATKTDYDNYNVTANLEQVFDIS